MRQAITTKYLGPTNIHGSRIKAVARKRSSMGAEMSLTDSYAYEGVEHEHCRVAKLLAVKLGWSGLWVGGGNVDENGYVYVNVCADYKGAPTDSIGKEDEDWFFIARNGDQ